MTDFMMTNPSLMRKKSSELSIDTDHLNAEERKELNNMLPKLAKRISSSKSNNLNNGNESPTRLHSPTRPEIQRNVSTRDDNNDAQRRQSARKSRSGSITYKPPTDLPPEVEELRHRDIEPDHNSAAEIALSKAAAAGSQSLPSVQTAVRRASRISAPAERKIEGREIQQDHEQYALTYGMMLGIRVTTGRRDMDLEKLSTSKSLTSLLEEQELTPEDYETVTDLDFPPEGSVGLPFPTPPHKLSFTFAFKDYMPNVFRAVRSISNIDEADYMLSLAGDFNYIEFIANSKSGQYFFYSHDGKYMIKTQSKEESKLLRRIMPQYVEHLTANPNSLLVRFYGMHRVRMQSLSSKTYFVIMSSVFDTPKEIQVKYDLKGSTVGRFTSPVDCKEGAVQKDINLMESGRKICLGAEKIDIFYQTLREDLHFLSKLNIMDYSLLLGIHSRETRVPQRRRSSGVVLSKRSSISSNVRGSISHDSSTNPHNELDFSSSGSIFQSYEGGILSTPDANEIYFMGIIDILQLYNTGKKMENFFKGFTHDRTQLSAVDPQLYADRMFEFIIKHTDYDDVMEERKRSLRMKSSSPINKSLATSRKVSFQNNKK